MQNNREIMDEALAQVSMVFASKDNFIPSKGENELTIAFQIICKHLQVELITPPNYAEFASVHALISAITRSSHLRQRVTILSSSWWEFDNGPILAFNAQTNLPYALIFNKAGYYEYFDPKDSCYKIADAEFSMSCLAQAYTFYRTLPDKILKLKDLFLFSVFNQKSDFMRLITMQIVVGILGLFGPIATGLILDHAVPNANYSTLWQCIFGLLACAFSITFFDIAQDLAIIRLRFKTNAALEPAIWDRLLRLPTSFFQKYSPGDLTTRAAGIDTMQASLTGAALQSLLGGFFSIITLALMFFYSPLLAACSLGITILVAVFINASNLVLLKFQRPILALQGKLASLSFQYIVGIGKLRISNAESRAFSIWFDEFCRLNRLSWLSSLWSIRFSLARDLIGVLIYMGLYAMVGFQVANVSLGIFIAFNAAFGQFFGAVLSLAEVLASFITLVPLYERIKPILEEVPENEGLVLHQLEGSIVIKDVSFHYHLEHLPVLENINLHANAGEFIALTGATGSGKSTIFRLLLGFETPTKGAIYYDEQNLTKLNLRSLREQCGVVLQSGAIFPGTIFENIMGSRNFSLDKAWEVARLACLDKDIENMPMGMNTMLTERGGTLSVGQRQRLMIARALSRDPKILLLDEATSALDNITQAEVMHNIEQLHVTRIVAAHRLSTLMQADRIYVLDQGKIVQTGKYEELLNQGGIFRDLVKSQMV